MTTPKLSVIVPVYNVEKYLERCLNSILNQSFNDFELLLIDDGSKDGSGSICDEYAEKDARIRVFHKENGGVSSARNVGLDNTNGSYVIFVDSDDYLKSTYFEKFLKYQEYDLAVSGFCRFGAINDIICPVESKQIVIENQLSDEWGHSAANFKYWYPWCKMFRLSVINEYHIRFNESLFYSEDFCFVMEFMSHIDSFVVCPFAEYVHQQEPKKNEKFKMTAGEFIMHMTANDDKMELIENKCKCRFDKVQQHVHGRLFKNYLANLISIPDSEIFVKEIRDLRESKIRWINVINETYPNRMLSSLKRRLFLVALVMFPKFFSATGFRKYLLSC